MEKVEINTKGFHSEAKAYYEELAKGFESDYQDMAKSLGVLKKNLYIDKSDKFLLSNKLRLQKERRASKIILFEHSHKGYLDSNELLKMLSDNPGSSVYLGMELGSDDHYWPQYDRCDCKAEASLIVYAPDPEDEVINISLTSKDNKLVKSFIKWCQEKEQWLAENKGAIVAEKKKKKALKAKSEAEEALREAEEALKSVSKKLEGENE